MGHSLTVEALVLKTHDVGEADRFCILFTKERGKIAARARGVRKSGSRMGGTILSTNHVSLQIAEGSAGYLITDAKRMTDASDTTMHSFLNIQQGIELLLNTLHDAEPLPELFDVTKQFLNACTSGQRYTVLPFTLVLLALMGLLPSVADGYFDHCSDNQKHFIALSINRRWEELPDLSQQEGLSFSQCLAALVTEMIATPLKAGAVIAEMRQ